jgi:hypothetical protein
VVIFIGMSIYRSYFKKNNTIIRNSYVNTAKSPVTELKYGNGFSKFLLQLDLAQLQAKIASGDVIINSQTRHYLHMTNCIFGDEDALGEIADTQRASSFDLIVFKIKQDWDEGVGYEFDKEFISNTKQKLFSETSSNWYNATTASGWTEAGVYTTNISGITTADIINIQHFDNGNEDLHVDITSYINSVLTGGTIHCGIGVAFGPVYEAIGGAEFDQTVSFFSKYTQTFFEPYLETQYNDLVQDDRNCLVVGISQNLCLYVTKGGQRVDLDASPIVTLLGNDKSPLDGYVGLTTTKVAKGVYSVSVTLTGGTQCTNKLYFYDRWSGMTLNGSVLTPIVQKFVPTTLDAQMDFLSSSQPKYLPFLYGIQKGEKISRGDVRKVQVQVKEMISGTPKILTNVYYRIYIKEGRQQIEVVGWTKVNRTAKENNFFLDTSFLVPKEYFIDIKIENNNEIATMKSVVDFQIVSER